MDADERNYHLNTQLQWPHDLKGRLDTHGLVVQLRKAYATGGPSTIRALILDALRPYTIPPFMDNFPVPVPPI